MTAAAKRESITPQAPLGDEACLAANVNPRTGFATDYLNHFSEAIMLIELISDGPECRDDFFAWQPKKYDEHFAASKFKHRNVAIAAYSKADPALRRRLDRLADSMNEILVATRDVMSKDLSHSSATAIADLAVRWVKPLVVRAGAVINGTEAEQRAGGRDAAPQDAIDALLAR